MNLDEMILDTMRLTAEQRIEKARSYVINICNAFAQRGLDQDALSLRICDFIRLFVSADRRCSREEYDLINSIYNFDMPYAEFYEMTNGGAKPDFVERMDGYIDSLDTELKYQICLFGLCLLVSDDDLSDAEYALLRRLLA